MLGSPTATPAPPPPATTRRGRRPLRWPTVAALVSRGLLWTILAGYTGAIFLVAVTRAGIVRGAADPPWWLALLALLVVAATIVPVHNWLRRGIDRLVYDWPDDPYAVIAELNEQLDPARLRAGEEIVPLIAATIAATLKLPYVAITTGEGDGARATAHGTPPAGAELLTLPLAYRGEPIGELRAAGRRPGEVVSANDRRLLRDLARQVGIALHAAQLGESLQASREGLVSAREEERRRIRRDLHDSLGPTLASLRLQLGAVRRSLRDDPDEAEALIDGLRDDVREATAAIRRLVYGLRPPLLDEHGLAGALRGLGSAIAPATFLLELPAALPPLSAAVEVALYRIASEAVPNVAKHAEATVCAVRLDVGDAALTLTIRDDGTGLPDERAVGIGLTSMRERAAELGGTLTIAAASDGGTAVTAVIPRRAGA